MMPTLGRIVSYRSKTGRYTMAAVISAVQSTLYQPSVELGFVEPLSTETHVHLTVLTPGRAGARLPDTDESINALPYGGTYQENDIPFWDPSLEDSLTESLWLAGHDDHQPAGSWTWMRRS